MANGADSYTLTPEEQLAMAGQMREEKGGKDKGIERESEAGSEKKTLRQSVIAARQAMDIKARAKKKIEEKVMMPIKMGTGHALRWAWATLIPSWGLTLIYINMHVFLRWVFPSAFCKLGEEWQPKIVSQHSKENVAGTAFGIVEVMGLLLLDLAFLLIILVFASLIALMADIVENPLSYIGEMLGMVWHAIKGFFIGE